MTLKVGSLGAWHAVHILLALLTGGFWLVVYALHAIISVAARPTIVVTVPEGSRVEYYRGYPNVLGPDEYLDKPSRRHIRILLIAGAALVAVEIVAVGVVVFG